MPAFLKVTVSVAEPPGEINAVRLPVQVSAVPPFVLEQTSKLCGSEPLLVSLKVTAPCGTVFADSVNLNSDGFPATTLTVVPLAAAG